MENLDNCIKLMGYIFNRKSWLILFWVNIIGTILYYAALREVQDLFIGSLPGYYCINILKIEKIFLKLNNIFFYFSLSGFFIWLIKPSVTQGIVQEILNMKEIKNIMKFCVLSYILMGNLVVLCLLFLAFFFPNLLQLEIHSKIFSLWELEFYITWIPVLIGAWLVLDLWDEENSTTSLDLGR